MTTQSTATRPPRSMCVLADPYLTAYQVRSLEEAVERTGIEIPLVVVNDPDRDDYDPDVVASAVNGTPGLDAVQLFREVFRRERAWALVIAEKKLTQELSFRENWDHRVPVEDVSVFDDAEVLRVAPEREGDWNLLPEETVATVAERTDVAIRYGFDLIKGDVLSAPRFGVLSFHPADIREYRGLGPPQAFLDDRDVMGVTLQRITEEIDGGGIVAYADCDVSDCATLWEVYDRLRDLQTRLLAEGIENLRDPEFEPRIPDDLGPYYSIERRREPTFAARILCKNLLGRLSDEEDAA